MGQKVEISIRADFEYRSSFILKHHLEAQSYEIRDTLCETAPSNNGLRFFNQIYWYNYGASNSVYSFLYDR